LHEWFLKLREKEFRNEKKSELMVAGHTMALAGWLWLWRVLIFKRHSRCSHFSLSLTGAK
jgi:hypothetical protein